MFSKTLLKQDTRSGYKLFLIFTAVLALYGILIVTMYDPQINEKMESLMAAFPQGMLDAFGFRMEDNSLTGFLSSYLYGFLLLVFPMIYEIILANKLVAKLVDSGSMAYLLATPNRRRKIAATQGLFLFGSTALLIALFTGLVMLTCGASFPGMLDVPAFLKINAGVLLLHAAMGGICFFSSCLCNESKTSLAFGAGIPIAFFLLQLLGNMGGWLENLRYVTLFTLFDPQAVAAGEPMAVPFLTMGLLAAALYAGGVFVFSKRDLPL